ncbi:FAD-binding oxidoreductase [Microvirga brassicacearum]|uniref:FAD-binding oxidoreductase n=1 Tax=Microvirga brassicacearum TaxID=2580413 RepID=A0A5N3P2B1_9HYPH|nr:FAD-binding oxidoreductase [Microvirga brassicacearum]KAB0264086.1 FAD-binding oxidoreductase [Microvirga brassicacearum]
MTVPSQAEAALIETLQERLGKAHVLTAASDMESALVELRGLYRGTALAVVRPGDTQQVAFTIAQCAKRGVPVVAQGGNTGLVGGGVPFGGVVLSLARLNRVREIDPLNGTMTVEAGCVLQSVQAAAAAAGYLFPLSLASEGSCTIGGNLATNAGGTAVLRYGNTRELTLGLEVVLSDGRIWNGLKGLRKDNTGYDLRDLFIGSEGTLGIITAAVLKLSPAPKTRVTAFVGCASPGHALALFNNLRDPAGDQLTAFEYMPDFGLEIVLKHRPASVRPLAERYHSYALVELTSPRVDADLRRTLEEILASALEDGTIADAVMGDSEAQSLALWGLRENLSEVQRLEGGSIKHDVAVPVSRVAEFIEIATKACEDAMPGVRVCAFGHFGDGNIHFNLSQPLGMDKDAYLSEWARFNVIVHDIVNGMNGSIAAEHGIGLIKRDELARYKDPVALDLMRAIKRTLDPGNLLNPGKVVEIGADSPATFPVETRVTKTGLA